MLRMLAAFKADLPPHEFGWYITKQSDEFLVEDTTGYNWASPPSWRLDGWFTIKGYAVCTRCGARFNITHPFRTDENGLAAAVEKAKEHTLKIAVREPCWGDVPKAPRDYSESYAVMDGVVA